MAGQLQACSAAYPLVFLGVLGFVASIVAVLLAWTTRGALPRATALATAALGAGTIATGAALPSCGGLGAQSGGMPLLAGLVAAGLAFTRPR